MEVVGNSPHPVYHIIEQPGGIRHLSEWEVPTEEYKSARTADLALRHPGLSPGVLEHLETLEPFLDLFILWVKLEGLQQFHNS